VTGWLPALIFSWLRDLFPLQFFKSRRNLFLRRKFVKNFYPSRKPVHVRKTEIKTYNLGDHQFLVEATLKDTRTPRPGEDSSAAEMVLVHDLVAQDPSQGPDLTIRGRGGRDAAHPREGCREALRTCRNSSGLRIISGYTQKGKDLWRRERLLALTPSFLSLGPAAVRDTGAAYGESRAPLACQPRHFRVIDSCRFGGGTPAGPRPRLRSQRNGRNRRMFWWVRFIFFSAQQPYSSLNSASEK